MFTLQLPQKRNTSVIQTINVAVASAAAAAAVPMAVPVPAAEPQPVDRLKAKSLPSVDLVLVYFCNAAAKEENYQKMRTFLLNLEQQGLQLESHIFKLSGNINFILIHAPKNVLLYYTDFYNIIPSYKRQKYRIQVKPPLKFMQNELTIHDKKSPYYQRAPEAFSGQTPDDFTTSERALITYKILTSTEFGPEQFDSGIERLLNSHVFNLVFPIHDGPYTWTDEGPLNERQILGQYWAHMKVMHKQQPLDLIEKYFGTEIAYYFGWLGFYNRFLLFSGTIALLFFLIGLVVEYGNFTAFSEEICTSNKVICPRCYWKHCKFESLSSSCIHLKFSFLFDNEVTVVFSIFMLILGKIFLKYWKREEFFLQLRWNLTDLTTDISPRPDFERLTKHRRISPFSSDIIEPYVPIPTKCARIAITSSIIIASAITMAFALFAINVSVQFVSFIFIGVSRQTTITKNIALISSTSAIIISIALIIICDSFYRPIALWLTNLENPRTQTEFDDAFVYKCYALSFINNYSAILYILIMKGRLFTYPGDPNLHTALGFLRLDTCDPFGGCNVNLTMQLIMTLVVKDIFILLKQFSLPRLSIFLREVKFGKKRQLSLWNFELKQWEEDYLLNMNTRYNLLQEYVEMVIQFGFVIFFISAFPLAPVVALINNLFELRIDAYKQIHYYQRRLPLKIAGLGAWNGILKGIIYIGIISNSMIIAFRSRLIDRLFYKFKFGFDPAGYINWIFSTFAIDNNFITNINRKDCIYPGMRYPPKHPKEYQLTTDFWQLFATKLIFVVVYELFVFLLMAIVVAWIPTISMVPNDYLPQKGSLPNLPTERLEMKKPRRSF